MTATTLDALTTHDKRDFSFQGCHACTLDPELDRLSRIKDSKDRTDQTLAYLRSLNGVWPPQPPEADIPDPQSPSAARYLTRDGQITYDPTPQADALPLIVHQIHASLLTDTDALLTACPTTHNRYGTLGTALTAYRAQLNAAPGEIVAFTFWKAGNDLRKRLKADAAQEEDALQGMPKLDPERAALLEGLVETHNVLVSNMPELEAIDISTIDPAERARMASNRALISDVIGALEDQVRLFLAQVRTDLADLNAEAHGSGAKAERAAVLTDESLHNLIREAVAQAVLQMKDPPKSMVATFASQTPGAAVGVMATGSGPIAAAYFPELVVMLEPYLAQLATHWQATSPNMRKTIDWVAARVKHGEWRA